jgi:Lar family restriction alleviation protein
MTKHKATATIIKLAPCPFCGEKAAWGEGEQKTKYGNEQVYCTNCYAMTAPEGSKEEAAHLWNDRNDASAALSAEVAQLREACKKALTCATLNSDVRQLIVAALKENERGNK